MAASHFFPLPDKSSLAAAYVGKSLKDVPVPSAILDLAKVKENCRLMLDAVKELNVDFRAHIKTHKTTELTRYQVGHDCKDVRLICSTVVELEHLIPLIKEYQMQGAKANVLYGVPPGTSHLNRLAGFIQTVGASTLTLMIDHPAQLETAKQVSIITNTTVKVFLKTDSGYHRAGQPPTDKTMKSLVETALTLETQEQLEILGFYSHNSLSYGGSSPQEAMDNLRTEIEACTLAAQHNFPTGTLATRRTPLTISCGASPTALSLQNLLSTSQDTSSTPSATALRASLATAKAQNIHFEIHAGVYPTLDMQQISATSRSTAHLKPHTNPEDSIAFSVLTEICSEYPKRTEHSEALINAGGLALAREPCKSYRGHGVVSSWNMPNTYDAYSHAGRAIVDRVSQEHGILQWEDRERKDVLPVEYAQRVRIWPNHACITGAQFGWYLVVDSESGDDDVVKDVWVRWRGW